MQILKFVGLFVMLATTEIHAQATGSTKASTRVGLTGSIGGILGSVGGALEGETFDRANGYGDRYSFGFFITPSLSLNVEASALRTNGRTAKDTYILLGASLYPNNNSGFYLSAAVGHGRTETRDDGDLLKVSGAAFAVGAGYDIPVDNKYSLSPFVRIMGTTGGGFEYLGTKYSDANINQLQIGLSVSFR